MKKKVLIILVAGLVFLGFFVRVSMQEPPTIVAIEVKNSTGAKIFVKALYPEGFREIKPTAIKGETIYLDLSELKQAWEDNAKKRGQGAEPFIVLTIVKDGKVAVHGISLKGDSHYQKITVVPNYKPLQPAKDVSSESTSSETIQPTDSYWEILEEYREETIPAVVAEIVNADYSWGQLTYSYMANAYVGFGVYVFANSEWSRIGTHYTYNVNGGGFSHVAFDRGGRCVRLGGFYV